MTVKNQPAFLPDYSPTPRESIWAVLALALLLVALRYEAIFHINSHFIGGVYGDAGLYIWLVEQGQKHLFELPWFNTQGFYPYGLSLAWSDNFILPTILALPWLKLGLSTELVFNLLILCAGLLNGVCTFRLCYKLHGDFRSALACGATIVGLANLTNNLGHPQLQFLFWIPLGLELLLRYCINFSYLRALLLGLCLCGTFLSTVYYAIFLVVAIICFLGGLALLRPSFLSRRTLLPLLGGGVLGVMPLIPFVIPYLQVRGTFGARGLYEAYYFSANALSYLSAPALSLIYSFSAPWSNEEGHLFGGMVLLLLVGLGLKQLGGTKKLRYYFASFLGSTALMLLFSCAPINPAWSRYICAVSMWSALIALAFLLHRIGHLERQLGFEIVTKRALKCIILFSAFVFLCISFGPLGNPEKGHWAFGVFRLFYEVLPGMDSIRAISRAGIITLFFFVCFASMTLVDLVQRKLVFSAYVIHIAAALMLFENSQFTYPLDERAPRPLALQRLLAEPDASGVIIGLPLTKTYTAEGTVKSWGEFAALNVRFMHWFSALNLPFVNGYSGQRSKLMLELPWQTAAFPDKRSLEALGSIGGLRYILYSSALASNFDAEFFKLAADRHKDQLRLLDADQSGNYLFELRPILPNGAEILYPSYPSGEGSVQIIRAWDNKLKSEVVTVSSKDRVLKVEHIETSNMPMPSVSFKIPTDEGPVRPARIKISSDSAIKIAPSSAWTSPSH